MIQTRNLTKAFGKLLAVDNLNLEIPRGELFCFLGPNGAGKTTTIKMLTGLIRPTGGSMSVCGADILRDPVAVKKLIGYIPDMPFLYERLTPLEYCRFSADLYDVPRAEAERRIDGYFATFSLNDYRNALIKDLSHGMRQRLIYCATFLHDPAVLFIDEPLIGLDPRSIRMIKTMLRDKARAGTTIFLTTHILALAEAIADRIAIIHNGRVIAMGTMEELTRQSGIDGNLEEVFLSLTRTEAAAAGPESPR